MKFQLFLCLYVFQAIFKFQTRFDKPTTYLTSFEYFLWQLSIVLNRLACVLNFSVKYLCRNHRG